jgi:hypothetical protein
MLTGGKNPYFQNISAYNYWLSADLRVFSVTPTPGIATKPFHSGTRIGNLEFPSVSSTALETQAGYQFIESLLPALNSSYYDPYAMIEGDPFESAFPDQTDAFTSISSIAPGVTEGGTTYASYDFAVARVRLNGNPGSTNARVFFRLFMTPTTDYSTTDYDPTTTYLYNQVSTTDSNPGSPLVGAGAPLTLPMFATGRSW